MKRIPRSRSTSGWSQTEGPRSPASLSQPADRKESNRCERGGPWEREVAGSGEEAFRSPRRYRCEEACVDKDEGEGLLAESRCEVSSRCARWRSVGPYSSAKPR